MPDAPVIEVKDLHKTFKIGFFRKKVEAVRGIDFKVEPGQIFGLLGPNGAGKTTTIKMILRLIFPSQGEIKFMGKPMDRDSMKRIGYMPENPYVYQYLKPIEFLDLCGRLLGMDAKERRTRSHELVEKVGLRHAIDRPVGKFSKGMMQRIGIAQALLHDPEVLVLDEPMSGLDPVGRKEIRDLLVEQRSLGKTLVFTSHILSDVEMLCDNLTIMSLGKVIARGSIDDLLKPEVRQVDVELENVDESLMKDLEGLATTVRSEKNVTHVLIEGDHSVPKVLDAANKGGAKILAVIPKRETLEDLFVRNAMAASADRNEGTEGTAVSGS